jgi:hypothetical protein
MPTLVGRLVEVRWEGAERVLGWLVEGSWVCSTAFTAQMEVHLLISNACKGSSKCTWDISRSLQDYP